MDCMYSTQISCPMTGVLLRGESCSGFIVRHLYVSLASCTSCLRRWILRWSCELHRYTSSDVIMIFKIFSLYGAIFCRLKLQLKGPVKGKLTDMLKSDYEGFDSYNSSETILLNVMMMEVRRHSVITAGAHHKLNDVT